MNCKIHCCLFSTLPDLPAAGIPEQASDLGVRPVPAHWPRHGHGEHLALRRLQQAEHNTRRESPATAHELHTPFHFHHRCLLHFKCFPNHTWTHDRLGGCFDVLGTFVQYLMLLNQMNLLCRCLCVSLTPRTLVLIHCSLCSCKR